MLTLQSIEQNKNNQEEIKETFLEQCYMKDWLAMNNTEHLIESDFCLLCGQIAKNAIELTCDEHENSNEFLIVGEECLTRYLNANGKKCPVQGHDSCKFWKSIWRHFVPYWSNDVNFTAMVAMRFCFSAMNNSTKYQKMEYHLRLLQQTLAGYEQFFRHCTWNWEFNTNIKVQCYFPSTCISLFYIVIVIIIIIIIIV
ncbi:hypothetical protein RFI_07065, partial [Reticulomyxa filosa]